VIVKTDYLGDVEVDESEIYTFEEGIYGFPDSHRYVFLGEMSAEFPFFWMQSLDESSSRFVVTNPFAFKESYDFELSEKTLEELSVQGAEDLVFYTTVVILEDVKKTTTNLKSPVVLNIKNHKGRQIILSEDYPYKYPIFEREA